MALRIYATAEIRKDGSMSKAPDLSAFPIPRKGGARPIEIEEAAEASVPPAPQDVERPHTPAPAPVLPLVPPPAAPAAAPKKAQAQRPTVEEAAAPTSSGQIVATTVKLDENRYLRLAEAGRPGPGRLKRRTIQEMVTEALDEWFEKRGL
jgi:hypothetical protein